MLTYLAWPSKEASPRLTPDEVNTLFGFMFQAMQLGHLSNGKFEGASRPLYWQRLNGGN
jgi:hypothetical protein